MSTCTYLSRLGEPLKPSISLECQEANGKHCSWVLMTKIEGGFPYPTIPRDRADVDVL